MTGFLVLVGSAGATSFLVVGCGGDDSGEGPTPDAGSDQAADSPSDTSFQDHAADSPAAETGSDGGIDASDTGPGADADADADVGDTALPDAPTAVGYVNAVALAYCARLQSCCELDAGDFSLDQCIASLYGNPLGTGEATPYLDSGLVAYNAVEAQQCLNDLANFPCGTVNAMQEIALTQHCSGAFSGTQTAGGPCMDSVECPATDYCLLPADGGVGACATLIADGGTCTHPFGSECSYLGQGNPALYCDSVTLTCMPQEPTGASCTSYISCASEICTGTGTYTCSATYVFSDPGAPNGRCATVTAVPDAGGD